MAADPPRQRLPGERVTADGPRPSPGARAERRSGELSLRELLRWSLAPAHLDAHRADPAAPARAGRRARLAHPAGAGRRAQGRPVEGRSTRRSRRSTRSSASSTSTARRGSRRSTSCWSSRWSAASCRARSSTRAAMRAAAARGAAQPDPAARPRVVRTDGRRAGRRARAGPGACSSASATGCARTTAPPTTRSAPSAATCARSATWSSTSPCWWCWSASRSAALFGYKGGVILVTGHAVQQQPDAVRRLRAGQPVPGRPDGRLPLHRRRLRRRLARRPARAPGMARGFDADVHYREGDGEEQQLRPAGQPPADHRRHRAVPDRPRLRAGGHRPRRRGRRRLRPGRRSSCRRARTCSRFGVVKAPDAKPEPDRARGVLLPDVRAASNGNPVNLNGDDVNPLLSLNVYRATSTWTPASRSRSTSSTSPRPSRCRARPAKPLRIDLASARPSTLPDGLGHASPSTTSYSWQRIQISQTPGKRHRAAAASCSRCSG